MKAILSFRHFARWLWLGTMTLYLFAIGIAFFVLIQERHRVDEQVRLLTDNYSKTLEGELGSFIRNIDSTLLTVADEVDRENRQGGINGRELEAFLAHQNAHIPEALGLRVSDAQGISRYEAGNTTFHLANIADRAYFIQQRDDPAAGLVITAPLFGRTSNQPIIIFSRRLVHPDGSFAGEVHASVSIAQLTRILAKLDLGPHGNSGLWSKTTLIARYAKDDPHSARTGAQTPSAKLHQLLASGTTDAFYHTRSGIDGVMRLYRFNRVGDYPLYMLIGLADQDYLGQWQADAIRVVGFTILFILATTAFAWLAQSAWKQNVRLLKWNELLLSSAGEGIYGVNVQGICTFINPAALAMLGFDEGEVIGRNQHELFHHHHGDGSTYPEADCPIYATLHDGRQRQVEDVFLRKDGAAISIQMTATPMYEDGRLIGGEVVFQDITQRKKIERELNRLATTDSLTGIANRRSFFERMETELARTKRFGEPASLLMVDLDHFKRVNDTYGHSIGDSVLQHFAGLAGQRIRQIDSFGRLGGEEFGIVLVGTNESDALQFADNLRQYVADTPVQTSKGVVRFTVSIGVTGFGPDDPTPDAILVRADDALYQAKAAGRNAVRATDFDAPTIPAMGSG